MKPIRLKKSPMGPTMIMSWLSVKMGRSHPRSAYQSTAKIGTSEAI
jgi:hypothetical protein